LCHYLFPFLCIIHFIVLCHNIQFMFQINGNHLDNFLTALQVGYSKYSNPYHNLIHGADVAQTVYALLQISGLMVSPSSYLVYSISEQYSR